MPGFWQKNLRNGEVFRDKVVLVGATAEGLKDYHSTPFGRLSGPEIQLHILAAMLRNGWLGSTGPWIAVLSILAAAVGVLPFATLRRNPMWFLLWLVVGAAGWLGICLGVLAFGAWFLWWRRLWSRGSSVDFSCWPATPRWSAGRCARLRGRWNGMFPRTW